MAYIIGQSLPDTSSGLITDKIESDKINFLRNGDKVGLGSCKLILGEIQRDPNKNYSNENVTKILQILRKTTLKNPVIDGVLVNLIDTYIPSPVSDTEVKQWLNAMGFTTEKIKEMGKKAFSIIGMCKKHFNNREINTEMIKNIIDGSDNTTEHNNDIDTYANFLKRPSE